MKRFLFLLTALVIAVMSWEHQLEAAVYRQGPIPQESIRLRIIANSDSIQDQWLKREVRDAIVARMNEWVQGIRSYEEARQLVSQRLPELKVLVEETIRERGFSYPAEVDFGRVPFPTKLYGAYVYPAGEYEALRVRIGEAQGQNWWCVLFPPLCFIDMADGDAVAAAELETGEAEEDVPDPETDKSRDDAAEPAEGADAFQPPRTFTPVEDDWRDGWFNLGGESEASPVPEAERGELAARSGEDPSGSEETDAPAAPPAVQIRFFLWDKLMSIF